MAFCCTIKEGIRALAGFAMGQGGKKLGQKAIQEGIKKGTTTGCRRLKIQDSKEKYISTRPNGKRK